MISIQRLEEIIKNKGLDGLIYFAEKVIKSEFIIMTAENSVDRLMFFKIINTNFHFYVLFCCCISSNERQHFPICNSCL